MAFQQGLSGINNAARSLDVISHNVANSNTVGFKAGAAQFADVFSVSLGTGAAVQIGSGANLAGVRQSFTQGGITTTGNPLDMAINGDGFFIVRRADSATPFYTRNGQFDIDKDGFVVSATGERLMGYPTGATSGDPQPMQISFQTAGASATSSAELTLNLDGRAGVIAGVPDPTDPASYTHATSMVVYDSLGVQHSMSLYFNKTSLISPPAADGATAEWQVYSSLDGGAVQALGAVRFNDAGQYISDTLVPSSNVLTNGANSPLDVALDLDQATQYGTSFSVAAISQDGRSAGELSTISVTSQGVIQASYTSGEIREVGRVALATFRNPNGLVSMGNNLWAASVESGQATPGSPGSGTRGLINGGAVEDSNIDLTAELVQMIVQQRAYQANAQSIQTQDQILQTVINLR